MASQTTNQPQPRLIDSHKKWRLDEAVYEALIAGFSTMTFAERVTVVREWNGEDYLGPNAVHVLLEHAGFPTT